MKISVYAIPGIKNLITVEFIQYQVSRAFNVTVERMKEHTRKREVVEPRQTAMYFLKIHTTLPHYIIGEIMGGYDHATVTHALKTVNTIKDSDKVFRDKFENIERILTNEQLTEKWMPLITSND